MESVAGKSLRDYNTFGIDVKARKFISVQSLGELKSVLQNIYASELFVLGGGSNMLLTGDLDKTVVHIGLRGIHIIEETDEEVVVQAMAGENWHQFVLWCIDKDFGGIENLSLIPGNVGTTPIQNIGAYGVEIKDTFERCTALNVQTLEEEQFSKADCQFGYRDSVFKNAYKGKYIITSVTFRLSKGTHRLHTEYKPLRTHLESAGILAPTLRDISDAVIQIRQSKLPDPRKIGNSGSFFKNPIVTRKKFLELQQQFPQIPYYELSEDQVKIPAGWMIEQAGMKGYRDGDAGVHQKQALVLVNYGEATGEEVLRIAKKVQVRIEDLFDIHLQPEVNIF